MLLGAGLATFLSCCSQNLNAPFIMAVKGNTSTSHTEVCEHLQLFVTAFVLGEINDRSAATDPTSWVVAGDPATYVGC